AGSGAGSAGADEALPPEIQLDKAAVQKVVDAWLAAQNAGDFAAYSALYADKMEGVKRVGARTWLFDRKGWLADRERMFKNKMTVAAKDVQLSGSPVAPIVELTQTFTQGKFSDEGTKRMVLVKQADGYHIAREEMLRSTVAGAMAGAAASQLWLPITLDGKTYAVLDDHASDDWGSGKLRGPFNADFSYAMRDATKVPTAASWAARQLAVYDAEGTKCPAKLGALQLVAGGTPHFGEVQEWDGADGGKKWSNAARARAIYEMSPPKLIGELQIEGDCAPVIVVDAASTPKVFAKQAADPAKDAIAIAAFRKLPAYQTIQQDFVDNYEGKGPWIETPTVEAFSDGSRRIVAVSAREGSGCGDFYGAMTAIFEDKGGKLVPLSGGDQGYLSITAVLDVDGDGKLELVADPDDFSTVTALYEDYAPVRSVQFPFNDCGC
ncbi:MAG TPA: hypothetical protein VHE35_06295, partial [Kofleriaceae bacterium]|nr:hypothetical protein [Kofleriaceae bacterium]